MQIENYAFIDSILYHYHNNKRKNNKDELRPQIVIPSNLRWFLLKKYMIKLCKEAIMHALMHLLQNIFGLQCMQI